MALIRSSSVSPSASGVPSASSSTSPSPSASPSPSSSPSPSPAPPEPSLEKRVSSAFERLSASASSLNAVSDELSKPIAAIDGALKALNLGVTAWVEFAGDVDHNAGYSWERSIGYAKVSGKWGIAISTSSGSFGDEPNEEIWLFGDAPRSYRLDAVDKLPELIEELVGAADETAKKLRERIGTTSQIAHAITQSPAALREAFLAEFRKAKQGFYNSVVPKAQSVEITKAHLVLRFPAALPKLFEIIEQNRTWLEELAARVAGQKITLSIDVAQAKK